MFKPRKSRTTLLLLLGLALSLSAAYRLALRFAAPAPLPALTLCLEWLINPHHAPLVVGIEKGFFKEAGIDLQLIPAGSAQEGSKQVAFGKADLAIASQPQLMIKVAKGLPLVRVATLIPTTLEVFVSKVPIAALKGKKIGHCSSMGFSRAVLQKVLAKGHLQADEVQETLACNGLSQALLTGKVDAVMNMYRSYALADLQQFNHTIISYNIEDLGIPVYEEMIVVANAKLEQRERIINFVKALKKSLQFVQDQPAQAWQIFIAKYPEQNTKINKQVWPTVVALFTRDPFHFKPESYQEMQAFLEEQGLLAQGRPNRYTVDFSAP